MENECEALPGVAYPGVRDNRSTVNTKTGYDDDDDTNLVQKCQSRSFTSVRVAFHTTDKHSHMTCFESVSKQFAVI